MKNLTKILEQIDNIVWGLPLIILIMVTGIMLTIRLRGIQVRHLGKALKYMVKNEEDGEGEVTSFGALCTALSATIGTGNIVGVATAIGILAGGPGALFWMWVAAFFGMATKYAEGFLAVRGQRLPVDGPRDRGRADGNSEDCRCCWRLRHREREVLRLSVHCQPLREHRVRHRRQVGCWQGSLPAHRLLRVVRCSDSWPRSSDD